ncbi:DNA primase [Tindallia magadiensis]|uniref:DNA primase n=1 Tax=Tindallia magadiensis TaxID=69895 RepID=A0A1I3FVM3_9FIRM|nr:DNA primase [Tindallia magadiensis]SFI15259.1 DNA primase [Tindallia magadiensis]
MKGRIPEELVDDIIQHNDIVDVINEYVPLKSAGSNYRALCPFHNEKTPSFMVSREKQLYKCFGCGQGGGVVQFIMEKENLDFVEAVHHLARRVGIHIPEKNITQEEKQRLEKSRKMTEINREAASFFYHSLTSRANKGFEYLKSRGWKKKTIQRFGIGFAPDQWDALLKHLTSKGYEAQLAHQAGLVTKGKTKNTYYDRFRKRLMFPIFNSRGDIVGFGGRVIDAADQPKYLNSPETSLFNKRKLLYGLNLARVHVRESGSILVTEGYTDVISLHEKGYGNAVATLGTSLTVDHVQLLSRYTKLAILCFDADTAGSSAVLRSIELFSKTDLKIKILTLPEGTDPDQYIRRKGQKAFESLISEAPTSVEYQINLIRKKHSLATVEGKIHFAREVTQILSKLKSAVEREAYAARLAEEMGISKTALLSEIKSPTFRSGKQKRVDKWNQKDSQIKSINSMQPIKDESSYLHAERQLLKWMISNIEALDSIENQIDETYFFDESHKMLFTLMIEQQELLKSSPEDLRFFEGFEEDFQKVLQTEVGELSKERIIKHFRISYKKKQLTEELKFWMEKQKEIETQEDIETDEKEDEMLKIGVEVRRINIELQKISLQKGGGDHGK